MHSNIMPRLMAMMFLQFFIWGSWYATGGNYMNSHGMRDVIYIVYLASPIGSIVSPFFLGMIADRFFSVQKLMGVLHILSGIFVCAAPFFGSDSPPLFLTLMFLHMLCYMPTVSLSAASVFHLADNKEKDFPFIRVFGTIGWITAGFLVSYVFRGDNTAVPMYTAAIASIVLGVYSFSLPDIPPKSAGKKVSFTDIIGWHVLSKFTSKHFIIFIAGLLLISIPFASYFAYVPLFLQSVNVDAPGSKMIYGQMSEVLFLLMMPWLFRRLGIKWVLIMGLLAWTIRYGLFAAAAPTGSLWLIMAGIIIHGACYDFVYVASQVYIDKNIAEQFRAQAQGFFVLVSYGVGQGLGTLTAGWIFNSVMKGDSSTPPQWQTFWTIPLLFAAVVTVMFLIGFKEKVKLEETEN